MTYRTAFPNEADNIAHLHTLSWQSAYRGILSDDFLDNHLRENRLDTWRKRFETPSVNQQIFVAEDAGKIIGFVCIYIKDDPKWGALIDNLHVRPDQKGKGIGKKLMDLATHWIEKQELTKRFYLWVYKANRDAFAFYEKIGGQKVEEQTYNNPDGTQAQILRMAW